MDSLPSGRHIGMVALFALAMLSVTHDTCAEDQSGARGTVTINTEFPGGNVEVLGNEAGVVKMAPDLRGDKAWFYWYFEAVANEAGRVKFIFPEKVAGFTNGGIGFQGPAISTDSGKSWEWMGVDRVENNSFSYEFGKPNERVRFAVTIPYVEADLDAFLTRHASNPNLKRSVLTKSEEGRNVELIQIGTPGPQTKPMLVTCRHHAAETMASYVLEGFLAEAMADSEFGRKFRQAYVLYAVPLVDTDGVEEGDQGKNRNPHDHNRDYGENSIYPEIRAIKKLDEEQDFRFALDFHCPTLVMNDHQVMYFVGAKDHPKHNFENVSELAGWIKRGLPETAPVGPLVWLQPAETPKPMNSHYFGFKESTVMAATLEFPFAPAGKDTDPPSCREYGRIILRSWVNTHFVSDFEPPADSTSSAAAKPAWTPPLKRPNSIEPPTQSVSPEITITVHPKPTADLAKFDQQYVIELERFNISDRGTRPDHTSKGLNAALQHAKSVGANHIVFPMGTYLISENEPLVLDHQDTVIDLNGSTLQINPNGLQRCGVVEIVDGAKNLRLTNGTLRGDKDVHDYELEKGVHGWGHGLIVHGGSNLEIDHITATNFTGDGVNSRYTGARNRKELLANIMHSIYPRDLESGGFSDEGHKITSHDKIRTASHLDIKKAGGEFEFGYSTGYLGYPFIQCREYQAYFFDDAKTFLTMQTCLQFRKVTIPREARYVHLEFDQPAVPDEPLHAGAGKGSFAGRLSNFKGPVDVHFHHNRLIENRRLGMGYCGGRKWLIEENLFARNGGVAPAYGIDLEDGWEFMQDVVIRNNRFEGNVAGDLAICAGSELLVEGNEFASNVVVHARPHNYTFRKNHFTGGLIGYKTRTGVAKIHDNKYENCTLSIRFDTAAIADGLSRRPGEVLPTDPLTLQNAELRNVEVRGTYFDFRNSSLKNVRLRAGDTTRLVSLMNCSVDESSVYFEADGPQVITNMDATHEALEIEGPGLSRRSPPESPKLLQ